MRVLLGILAMSLALQSGCGGGPAPATAGRFRNPVIKADFPDPFVLRVADSSYAYATGAGAARIQVARSEDLVHWRMLPAALTTLPHWQSVEPDKTWAPDVSRIGDRFVMYYVGASLDAGRQCISVATADRPDGPFLDLSAAPLVCQAELGGSIDPTRFVDSDGAAYLLWKNDGNCCDQPADLWGQRLSEDGLTLTDQPRRLGIRNDQAWEGTVVEAPTVLAHGGRYYLFYSANAYDEATYAVGYGVSDHVLGPYTKPLRQPILSSGGSAAGPGGQSVVMGPRGDLWLAYHAWAAGRVGYRHAGVRSMWMDRLSFEGDRPVVHGPTNGWQPSP
ncbi:glycoside hydrolase family 43 protein [Candidatus Nephthysia bennettiae]|uniref:Family 43 glycosylhydrolase n=1 Tax=Candidatus Nephthysia bennettiae TaxID=3127016 RepID=A0A934K1Y9_9BACT|nr:family 43 glycosylhydrolase [Candidatus Dormibacteraeota bacterium]MBJ7614781.1 family 43 glycosylhydrolase [Candidatus Dormibacteraeota bacterium]